MNLGKIGVVADSFRCDLATTLQKACQAGVDGVQFYMMQQQTDLSRIGAARIRELRRNIVDLGLTVSAICCELGEHGIQVPEHNPRLIASAKRAIDLALALDCRVVTTHIGMIPEDEHCAVYDTMLQACEELGNYATVQGAFFAVETGPEPCFRLKEFLDKLSTNGVSVNFDPANLVMVVGDDPIKGVHLLGEYIVHTHVKDGKRLAVCDPRDIYGYPGHPRNEAEDRRCCKEVPLGQGEVDFPAYFTALSEIGYGGYLTIERETGQNPEQDIREAVQFIRQFMAN